MGTPVRQLCPWRLLLIPIGIVGRLSFFCLPVGGRPARPNDVTMSGSD
eukprot:COSAG06_NODE_11_length_35482_cov_68.929888_11_plen_48_part_00